MMLLPLDLPCPKSSVRDELDGAETSNSLL